MASSELNTYDRFFAPARTQLEQCTAFRNCPSLSDQQWIELGVSRAIEAPISGRGYLQSLVSRGQSAPGESHFFETLRSKRRLALCSELSESIACRAEADLPDALARFACLKDFEPELCSRNQEGSFELINSCPDFVHPRAFTSGQ